MTDTNKKILELILRGATINEISSELNITNKQLYYRLTNLKNKGYDFIKKYYYDGETTCYINRQLVVENNINLITPPSLGKLEMVFISDLHLSNVHERLDLLDELYNFCIKDNIHIIINGGDLIDGFMGPDKKKFNTYEEQIEYAIKKYPFDKNILNFICLGNHDYTSFNSAGQNLEKVLLAKRQDIISLGYGEGILNIKNDQIILRHPKTPVSKKNDIPENRLILYGHSHRMKSELKGLSDLNLYLPSLSDLDLNERLPGMIKATICFNRGWFEDVNFEQYVFFNKLYKVNEMSYNLLKGKNVSSSDKIKNEEVRNSYKNNRVKKLIY